MHLSDELGEGPQRQPPLLPALGRPRPGPLAHLCNLQADGRAAHPAAGALSGPAPRHRQGSVIVGTSYLFGKYETRPDGQVIERPIEHAIPMEVDLVTVSRL